MILIGCCVGSMAWSCQRETSPGTTTAPAGPANASQPVRWGPTVGTPPVPTPRVPVNTKPFMTLDGQNTARTNGPYLVSYSLDQGIANYWEWAALKPQPSSVDIGVKPLYARLTGDMGSVLYRISGKQSLVLKRISPSETIQSWTIDKELYCGGLAGEPAGRYIVVILPEEPTVTKNFDNPKIRLGLFDAKTSALTWPFTQT